MLLLGIDVGTSSIKVSIVDAASRQTVISAKFPEDRETDIIVPQSGWAEQSPDMWWDHVIQAILHANRSRRYNPLDIAAIGIAYQMHGLTLVDKQQKTLRNAIIWCDSRAVEIGDQAFHAMGEQKTLRRLLNSPGNFTASKLAWVKQYEPDLYAQVYKFMLPGDFIAMKLTGEITSSISALSEGILWDFKEKEVAYPLLDYYGINRELLPDIKPLFSVHGQLNQEVANHLGLPAGIPVAYKAGDQPNNALSLNVLKPGEIAATAGTSGVIYGVSDQLVYDEKSRINTFAHVNYTADMPRLGVLLCINGTGILYRWAKEQIGGNLTYEVINALAEQVPAGSEGLRILPFGNGAERVLENKVLGAQIHKLDLNCHTKGHLFRACQEGIAFSFRYGLDIMRQNGMCPKVIRAGKANLFLSELFTQLFVDVTGVPVELYDHDGSVGAALGAGIGAGIFANAEEAFQATKPIKTIHPTSVQSYDAHYQEWLAILKKELN